MSVSSKSSPVVNPPVPDAPSAVMTIASEIVSFGSALFRYARASIVPAATAPSSLSCRHSTLWAVVSATLWLRATDRTLLATSVVIVLVAERFSLPVSAKSTSVQNLLSPVVVDPILSRVVAASPKFIVVAVVLIRLKVVWLVNRLPPLTVTFPPVVSRPVPVVMGLLVVVLRDKVVAEVRSIIGDEPVS